MKIRYLLLLCSTAIAAACNQVSQRQNQFNPAIVEAKQKCQQFFERWKNDNEAGRGDQALRAHFNANLNACLVDYISNNEAGHSQTSKVVDIFDGNRTLLEMDFELPGNITGQTGTYLYEKGEKVTVVGDIQKEYEKRRAALFEEPAPAH